MEVQAPAAAVLIHIQTIAQSSCLSARDAEIQACSYDTVTFLQDFVLSAGLYACRGAVSTSGFATCMGSQSLSPSSVDVSPADTEMWASASSTYLQPEYDKLRKQLQKSQESSQKWQHLHAELHSACVSRLLNAAS